MSNIKLFQGKSIRSVWNEEEEQWYFVIEDVVAALTDSADPKQYIKRMKLRDAELAKGWVQIVPTLAVQTSGGKQRMNCANVKGLFRIIQSIPSPKAKPLGGTVEKYFKKNTFRIKIFSTLAITKKEQFTIRIIPL